METKVDEIAERIYRLSTFLPAVGPSGFTFNPTHPAICLSFPRR